MTNHTPCPSHRPCRHRSPTAARQRSGAEARPRHQFATEALDQSPRELANISQVLGHDSVETTLKSYIHPSANAEQRISAMMNARWTTRPAPAGQAG